MDVAAWRKAERARLLAARKAPSREDYVCWSEAITLFLVERLSQLAPKLLGAYWPHRDEYDPMPLAAWHSGRNGAVALPAVVAGGQPLEYRPWTPDTPVTPGRFSFGIPEPVNGPATVPDVLLVPLLGFDAAGFRLGYGGGYFDRTLAAYPRRPATIGVGFELGRMPTIQPQPHDIPLDVIVTEAGVFPRG
ncbi:MAG TPA: 5-formyltetrahydrofolate cyclo-ligase [Alphaproteobacteria bacterium]|jgi:5-formyltetrahydrofolate cyclo-ligase|nr:5-formyltetrahydrofolate cyclo-ligase [Alphaproteobacteria bacterium]